VTMSYDPVRSPGHAGVPILQKRGGCRRGGGGGSSHPLPSYISKADRHTHSA